MIARLRPKLAQVPGGRLFLIPGAGYPRRRPAEQRAISIHAAVATTPTIWPRGRRSSLQALGAQHRARRRQLRSAAEGPGNRSGDRSRHRLPARHHAGADRQYALRCVRPAAGVGHLQRDQPISRGHGDRSALHPRSAVAERHLCLDVGRRRLGHGDVEPAGRHRDRIGTHGNAASAAAAAAAAANNNSARNAAINALANAGKSNTSSGAAVSTTKETMVPLSAVSHYQPGNTPLSVSHQGLFVASTISFNLPPGATLGEASAEIDDAVNEIHMPASIHGNLAGTAQLFAQSANNEIVLIAGRDCRRLHRARRALRELRPPDHHSVDAAVGRRRRLPRADAVPHPVRHHRHDRRDSADRHRQEECDHDDRLRHRSEAVAQLKFLRCDLSGLHAALPPDHDDDLGGDPRRRAAGAELRQRRRNPPPARHLDHGRLWSSASC